VTHSERTSARTDRYNSWTTHDGNTLLWRPKFALAEIGMTASPRDDSDTIESLGEFGLIDRLARLVVGPGVDPLRPARQGEIAIGDDAAVWQPSSGTQQVLTTDALVEGVHFRLNTTSWRDLGWKALAENVSDIAAMGAVPSRAFVTLGLRGDTKVADLEELYRGLAALAQEYGVNITGGDVVSSPVTVISVTVTGELKGPGLRRAAGHPGDLLAVTGALGGSAGGLALLESGDANMDDPNVFDLVVRHRQPRPRVAEGQVLAEAGVRCGMDLSDGLLGDVAKIAYASDLAATVEIERLPLPMALEMHFGPQAAGMALSGGEDYELLVTGSRATLDRAAERLLSRGLAPLTIVGRLNSGDGGSVQVVDEDGSPLGIASGSWDHFRRRPEGA
jgi:thiamine-monophosphate kinase